MAALAAAFVTGAVVLGGLAVPAAHAEDGYAGPDPAYAGDGTLDLAAGGSPMVVDSQDRLLVFERTDAVGGRLTRYLPSGSVDAAFTPTDVPQVRASESTLSVLDSGVIRVTQRAGGSQVDRTIVQVGPSGGIDAAYGTGGVLVLADVTYEFPFLARPDGTIVVSTSYWGALRFRRFDAMGNLDSAFGTDGVAFVPCCGPEPEVPQAQSVEPDAATGGLVALIRHRSTQAVIRIAPDGTAGPELAIPAAGWATSLLADPFGGFFLSVQAGPDDPSGPATVHLGADLVPDAGSADASVAIADDADVRTVGARRIVTSKLGDGRVRLRAYTAAGLDPTYGTNGSVVTEAMAPLEPDQSGGPITAAVAVASDGRAIVASSWTWYPGFFNPYNQYASRIETYDADGRRLSRTDARNAPEAMHTAVPERNGTGFLLQSTTSNPQVIFTPPDPKPRVRRLVPPRADAVLGPVQGAAVALAGDQATVTWQRPAATPGLVVTGYEVEQAVAAVPGTVATKTVVATSTVLTLPATDPLTAHRIQIRPKGIDGALGPATVLVVVPGLPLEAFLDQLAAGFAVPTTAQERADAVAQVGSGAITPVSLVRYAAQSPGWSSSVDPVVRLYLAYFQRPPDPSGLQHWIGKRRTGTSVARISAVFADSREFKRTYGSLSNRAFVDLVYANVLGRAPDASGRAYWTGRLDRRATSRGHLMASFSESSEHVRRTRATVDTVSTTWGLLGRTPTSAELATWAGPSPAGEARALAALLLQSEEYRSQLD